MLISQPGSDYQLTQVTLDAGHARDITCPLLDIHAVLDHPEFGGDSILPRCSGLGDRCLPRYRRLTEPQA